jgi:hypothetical protein
MLSFKQFFSEENGGLDIPVVSLEENVKDKIDLINDQLDQRLNECVVNPYIGWVNASKTLSEHGITLPKVMMKDVMEGVEVVALNEDYYFYYEYGFVNEGYQTFASIVNETDLEKLLEEE